jgi:2'-5' RNA ligase
MPPQGLWRTFVAFPIAAASRAALAREAERLARLDPRLRVVPEDNFHVTVAFLGPTAPDAVPHIAEALEEAVRGEAAIEVRVEGVGAFPRAASPRVVWAGLVETRSPGRLAALVRNVRGLLADAGHPADDGERFHAHVTLARLDARSPSPALPPLLERCLTEGHLQDTYSPEVLSDLLLMISEPHANRTRYRPLAGARLE